MYYLSVARGNVTRLNSQVMIGGGCALILQDNLAMEPCVTTTDTGWIVKEEMPAGEQDGVRQCTSFALLLLVR